MDNSERDGGPRPPDLPPEKGMELVKFYWSRSRTGHGTMDWFKIRKSTSKAVCCHPAFLTDMQNISCAMLYWKNHKLESRLQEKYQQPKYADDTTLMAESEEELKSLLMKVKGETEKTGLKLNIQKTKIKASSPILSQQIGGEKVETVASFLFLGSKITVDSDCSHEIKRCLLLGRKAMTNLDSIVKIRDITLLMKVHIIRAMVFPVVMYGCESWTIETER